MLFFSTDPCNMILSVAAILVILIVIYDNLSQLVC